MFGFKKWLSKFLKAMKKIDESMDFGVMPLRWLQPDGTWVKFQISDGFERRGPNAKRGGKGHYGADFALRRVKSGKASLPEYTRHYYCPSDVVEAVACVAGRVVRIVRDGNGTAVYLEHGRYMSVYRHLKGVTVRKGQLLAMSDFIGYVSHAPKNKRGFNHLHFEIWDLRRRGAMRWGRSKQAVDPAPFVRKWDRA